MKTRVEVLKSLEIGSCDLILPQRGSDITMANKSTLSTGKPLFFAKRAALKVGKSYSLYLVLS